MDVRTYLSLAGVSPVIATTGICRRDLLSHAAAAAAAAAAQNTQHQRVSSAAQSLLHELQQHVAAAGQPAVEWTYKQVT